MVKIYDIKRPKTVKVFFSVTKGEIDSVIMGNQAVPTKRGIQFYLDDYVAEQIDKFNLSFNGVNPVFELKEGETLEIPTKEVEKKKEIEELEQRLRELKGETNAE